MLWPLLAVASFVVCSKVIEEIIARAVSTTRKWLDGLFGFSFVLIFLVVGWLYFAGLNERLFTATTTKQDGVEASRAAVASRFELVADLDVVHNAVKRLGPYEKVSCEDFLELLEKNSLEQEIGDGDCQVDEDAHRQMEVYTTLRDYNEDKIDTEQARKAVNGMVRSIFIFPGLEEWLFANHVSPRHFVSPRYFDVSLEEPEVTYALRDLPFSVFSGIALLSVGLGLLGRLISFRKL